MTTEKEKLLETNYQRIIDVGFCTVPYQDLRDIMVPSVVVFGTAKDEKLYSYEQIEHLFKAQYEQMSQVQSTVERNRIATQISSNGNQAIIIEEITLNMVSASLSHQLELRTSCCMEFLEGTWKLTHWHASTAADTENDPWHLEEWKRERAKLQNLVDQQTQELLSKNRELEIEASLERLRAASMAMDKTEDLSDVVMVYFEELKQLNIEFIQSWITIFHLDEGYVDVWFSPLEGLYDTPTHFNMPSALFEETSIKSWKEGNSFSSISFETKEQVNQFFQVCDDVTSSTYFGDTQKKLQLERFEMLDANHKFGCISKSNIVEASDEEKGLLKRFANVFEQTYTRFLDLQKAEAQAREAQIETALERVRSRTMAMQNSEELEEVILEVLKKLQGLGISMEQRAAAIFTYEAGNKDYTQWVASPEYNSILSFNTPYFDHPVQNDIWNARQNRTDFYAKPYPVEVKNSLFKYLFDLPALKSMPQAEKTKALDFKHYSISIAFQKQAALVVVDHSGIPLTEAENSILIRFSKVFNQTYTRFLDLQKAEDQARESQIQLSLERVRAKSMAMQSSDELHDVLSTLFQQFDVLGIKPVNVFLSLFDKEKRTLTYRASGKSGKRINGHQTVSMDSLEVWSQLFDKWKNDNSDEVEVIFYPKEILPTLFELLSETFASMPAKERLSVDEFPDGGYTMHGYTPFGYIGYNHTREATEEEKNILTRFATEFSRVYQRFLDIQKAEAQAREAQIETALERIRSRSMAMHNTSELSEVILVLFKQFEHLGLVVDTCIIDIFDDTNTGFNAWIGAATAVYQKQITLPYSDHPIHLLNKNARQEHLDFYTYDEDKESKERYFKHFYANAKDIDVPQQRREFISKSIGMTGSAALGKHSSVCIWNYRRIKYSNEENDILKRVNKVFQQTYQRFLDLQKAETQAREAQIEAALERVRSQSMSMQHSEELSTTTEVFHQQLQLLGIDSEFSYLWLPDENEKTHLFWATWCEGKKQKNHYNTKKVTYPLDKSEPSIAACYIAWESGEKVHINEVKPNEVEDYFNTWTELLGGIDKFQPQLFPDGLYYIDAYMDYGCFGIMIKRQITSDEQNILKRFSKEFQSTYTRFLDLQKAEAQAREAQIEMALERVRSRTMSMQHSDELRDAAQVLFNEVQNLGIPSWSCGYNLLSDDRKTAECYMSSRGQLQKPFTLIFEKEASFIEMYEFFKSKGTFLIQKLGDKKLLEHYDYMMSLPELQPIFQELKDNQLQLPTFQINHLCKFSYGYLLFITYEDVPYAHDIFKRFTKVFEQTYTRFLDLERAEAQAREAQIEAALEKIRARTMGMQHSNELPEAANDLFKEIKALGINAWSCGYNIFNDDRTSVSCVMSSEDIIQAPFNLPLQGEKSFKEWLKASRNEQDFFVQKLQGTPIKEHYGYLMTLPDIKKAIEGLEKAGIPFPEYQINHLSFFNHGFLLFITYEEVPEAHDIFKRFTKVFEQTYTRFLDLKRAEAQAREARIETALERVRSRSMGMQTTADFGEVTTEMFNQLRGFGEDLFATGIVFCEKHEGYVEQWHSIPGGGMLSPMIVPIDLDYIHQYRYDQWKAGKELFSIEIPSDFIEQHFEDIFKLPSAQITLKDLEARNAPMPAPPSWEIDYGASFNHGYILISSLKPLENTDILPRFAKVFEQAYTRFLDLQKAEEQAREAQIEAALEKVRSRTLAMQKSEELAETSVVVFKELLALGIEPNRLFIGIIKDNGNIIDAWATNEDGSKIEQEFKLHTSKNKSIKKMVAGWKQQKKSTIIDMKGKELQDYFHYLNDVMQIPFIHGLKQNRRVQTIAYFSGGLIGMAAPEEQPEETINLLERFAAVFNLTYTRFNDLKISESQTRKAKIETALERVRARALAMQEPEELKEVASVLRIEMGLLGIEELETCSIYILEDEVSNAECWYALKDAKAKKKKLISDHISMDFTKTWVGQQMLKFYDSEDENTSIAMTGKERVEWIRYCEDQSKVLQSYYGEDIPERTYHLQKFSNGAIGAASAGAISEESWALLRRCASVFSLAYSRFKDLTQAKIDLKRLKVEKKRAEEALTELQTTQNQLIQSEKMASLGELTAGIAHEIQNPLNFVNNFSEVSKELLEEMQEEIENGDYEEVKAIMEDIIQNLEKINHHGKRADGIVKGMLQHSRSSSGRKEPTDINALADEYFRLAYHGLRAKDKSFNAELITDFDESIGAVNVIPQDIGRVILNLITNAFYASNERKQAGNDDRFKPTVSVSTKKTKENVQIWVKDNGNGISKAVLDKIFQPFFTTKPTGQGTGLGLSMSYDIITKGHEGELKVETKEGEGSVFTILLPIKTKSI